MVEMSANGDVRRIWGLYSTKTWKRVGECGTGGYGEREMSGIRSPEERRFLESGTENGLPVADCGQWVAGWSVWYDRLMDWCTDSPQ